MTKLTVTKEIAKKFFIAYCHNNSENMAIVKIKNEEYAYDSTFGNGEGTEGDAGHGDAQAIALKIGAEINEEYFTRKYHIMAPQRYLCAQDIEKIEENRNVEWSDLYDIDNLYVKYEDDNYDFLDLENIIIGGDLT